MSDKPAAATVVADSKKRPRRLDAAQRQTAQEQEAARSQASQHSARFLSKHKTRCLPDAPGMCILSKNEVKKDIRFLERNSSFSVSRDSDEDSDNGAAVSTSTSTNKKDGKAAVKSKKLPRNEYNPHYYYGHGGGVVMRSVKPPCAPESSILRKKRRYTSWLRPAAAPHLPMQVDEAAIARELAAYETSIAQMQFHFEGFQRAEEHWLQNVEHARQVLAQAASGLATCNGRLEQDAEVLFSKCVEECKNGSSDGGDGGVAGSVSRSSRRVAAAAASSSAEAEPERATNLAAILRELAERQLESSRRRAAHGEGATATFAEAVFTLDEILNSSSSAKGAFSLPAAAAASTTASGEAAEAMAVEEESGAGVDKEEGEDALAPYLQVLDEVIRLNELSYGDADSFFVYRDLVGRDKAAAAAGSVTARGGAGREQYEKLSAVLCERGGAGSMLDVAARLARYQAELSRLAAAPQQACLAELLPAVDGAVRLDDQAYWAAVVEIVGRSSTLLHEAHTRREAESRGDESARACAGAASEDEEEDEEGCGGREGCVGVAERQHSLISLEPLRALLGSAGVDKDGPGGVLTAERALQLYMNATTATSSTTSTRKQSGAVLKKLVLTTVILMNVSLGGVCGNRLRGFDSLAKNAAGEVTTLTNYVPLLLSPLSQYADFYAGSITGGSVVYNDSTHLAADCGSGMARGGVRASSTNFVPADVAREEEALLAKLGVLAKILALQNYCKRCVTRRNDWKRQLTKAQAGQQKAQALLRDLLEDICVEREMQAQLLIQQKLQLQQADGGAECQAAENGNRNGNGGDAAAPAPADASAAAANKQAVDGAGEEAKASVGVAGSGSSTSRRSAGGRFSGPRR